MPLSLTRATYCFDTSQSRSGTTESGSRRVLLAESKHKRQPEPLPLPPSQPALTSLSSAGWLVHRNRNQINPLAKHRGQEHSATTSASLKRTQCHELGGLEGAIRWLDCFCWERGSARPPDVHRV